MAHKWSNGWKKDQAQISLMLFSPSLHCHCYLSFSSMVSELHGHHLISFIFFFFLTFVCFLFFPSHSLLDFFQGSSHARHSFDLFISKPKPIFSPLPWFSIFSPSWLQKVSLGWCGFRINGGGRWFGVDSCAGYGWWCGVNVCRFNCVCVFEVLN